MKDMIIISILGLLVIFFLNLFLGIRKEFGFRHYWFFEVLHFLGGFFMTMFLSFFFDFWGTLVALGIVTLLWEGLELLLAAPKFGVWLRIKLQLPLKKYSWPDTILDVFLNYVGALVFFFFLK